ncbi:MAG: type II toxin-antitoxin system HicA family toxin [Bacteroidota bacterium]|nr:type II toxin-antitoxin system HicA family toxin [Bacteroidota bacterium]
MPLTSKEALKILQKKGFTIARQKGSHVILTKVEDGTKYTTVVPMHKELRKGTIRSIAKLAGLDKKEFGL